jgi:hypothetical protein
VCHAFLTDAKFYQLLRRIAESIGEKVRARGCDCRGVLHSAHHPRKPRGLRSALDDAYESRLSFRLPETVVGDATHRLRCASSGARSTWG